MSTNGVVTCNGAVIQIATLLIGQVGYQNTCATANITQMTGTAGTVAIIGSINIKAGTWLLCADDKFQSTQASKALDLCQMYISPQTIQLSPADYGFNQSSISTFFLFLFKYCYVDAYNWNIV